MNSITPVRNTPTPAERKSLSAGQTAAHRLQVVQRTLRKFHDQVATLDREYPRWRIELYSRPAWRPHTVGERDRSVERWQAVLDALPPMERLESVYRDYVKALTDPPAPDMARIVVGLMIDAFPNARPHQPETYFETLLHELGNSTYSPQFVAVGCAELVRSNTFLPTVAEVLSSCYQVRFKTELIVSDFKTTFEKIEVLKADISAAVAMTDLVEDSTVPALHGGYGARERASA